MDLGHVTIPKSVTAERIEDNFRIWDFELSDEDMSAISGLDAGKRMGPDPAEFSLGL
jgi:diketogulonate reductase-like aldo/keto reductase